MFQMYRREELQEYIKDIKFWSNVYGDLHEDGLRSITEEELPSLLRKAYNELWDGFLYSSCHLIEYKGEPYIALSNEFDGRHAESMETDIEGLFSILFHKAYKLAATHKHAHVLLVEGSGLCDDGHEIFALISPIASKERFYGVADTMKELFYDNLNSKNEESAISKDLLFMGNAGEILPVIPNKEDEVFFVNTSRCKD